MRGLEALGKYLTHSTSESQGQSRAASPTLRNFLPVHSEDSVNAWINLWFITLKRHQKIYLPAEIGLLLQKSMQRVSGPEPWDWRKVGIQNKDVDLRQACYVVR